MTFDAVMEAVNRLGLVGGMTVTDVRGLGSGRDEPELYRGPRYVASYAERVKIELAIESEDVAEVERLIETIAKTGDVGDGKIFIMNLVDIMRIRTGERGASAL
jgi:nitrogen regulatory protein PII